MRFIYKIHSSYNGFTPAKIPERLRRGRLMKLGWRNYIEVVEPGHEVWIYFKGARRFEPGVYVMSTVRDVNVRRAYVAVHVYEHSTERPLTTAAVSRRIAAAVTPRGRQVFILRNDQLRGQLCTPERCGEHRCAECPVWRGMASVGPRSHRPPDRLADYAAVVPAYWAIPARCFIPPAALKRAVHRSSEIFYSFKAGERALAYPLARGMRDALKKRGISGFDCIVPIPLSPDKEKRGELHRRWRWRQSCRP